jgi:hypothetical protein
MFFNLIIRFDQSVLLDMKESACNFTQLHAVISDIQAKGNVSQIIVYSVNGRTIDAVTSRQYVVIPNQRASTGYLNCAGAGISGHQGDRAFGAGIAGLGNEPPCPSCPAIWLDWPLTESVSV